jgi:hypothetical protein
MRNTPGYRKAHRKNILAVHFRQPLKEFAANNNAYSSVASSLLNRYFKPDNNLCQQSMVSGVSIDVFQGRNTRET